MPLVEVYYGPVINEGQLIELKRSLPKLVAAALHVEEVKAAHLTETDVEVRFCEAGKLDVLRYDLEITVFANNYPGREANLQSLRVPRLANDVFNLLYSWQTFDVYVLLGTGGFADYRPARKTDEEWNKFFSNTSVLHWGLRLENDNYIKGRVLSIEFDSLMFEKTGETFRVMFSSIRHADSLP